MEKFGSFDRKKQQLNARDIWMQIAQNPTQYERPKEAVEIEIVKEADDRTSKVIEAYGLDSTSVLPQTVHIIDESKWPGGHAFMSREHGAFICESDDADFLKMKIVHEMFHLKGVNFLPIPLTEAIIERLTNQALNLENTSLSGSEVFSGTYTYNEFRMTLDRLLRSLINKAASGATSDHHSFSFFAKAHLSGRLDHLDFLDSLFGPGTLRRLEQLDDSPESFATFVNSLV